MYFMSFIIGIEMLFFKVCWCVVVVVVVIVVFKKLAGLFYCHYTLCVICHYIVL